MSRKRKQRRTCREFMYRDTTNVEHEMHDYTDSKWIHRHNMKMFKEKFGSHNGKTLNRFSTKDSYIRDIHVIRKGLQPET